MTQRGWVVLASDATHYYEHFEQDRCFPTVYNVGDTLEGYARLRSLAALSPKHIIPGHDPLVMQALSGGIEGTRRYCRAAGCRTAGIKRSAREFSRSPLNF